MAGFTSDYWSVESFGLQDADLGEFAEEHLLFVHPRTGRLYARAAELVAYIQRAFAERNALLAGKAVQRPMLHRRHWRQRLVSLPVL